MEIIGVIIVYIVISVIWNLIKGAASDGGGTNMPALTARIRKIDLDEKEHRQLWAQVIEVRGLLPLRKKTNIAFMTSLLDQTEEHNRPVLSSLERFQEPHTIAFQDLQPGGVIDQGMGFTDYVRAGVIVPDILQPPFSGKRKLLAVLRLIDVDDPPAIEGGYHDKGETKMIWATTLEFDWEFPDKGYREVADDRDELRGLTIKIAMAVAMADGSLDEAEGITIQGWIQRVIASFSDAKQEELKNVYNAAMKEGHALAKTGDLSLSDLTQRFNEIGDKPHKFEALQLCHDVMTADGHADVSEINLITSVSKALNMEDKEVELMRDHAILGLDSHRVKDHENVEELVGIDPHWSEDQAKSHLTAEFRKWSNRLNTLPEGEERAKAQHMLDLIGRARRKYE